jgi:uncharacterized protein YeaO (DUF488 family)
MGVTGKHVRAKRVYDDPAGSDGTRVLVDRIWPRGLSRERAAVDVWLKDIAPTTELRKWFGHDPARWKAFEARYRQELDRNAAAVAQLRELVDRGPVTLLYGARDDAHNDAVALLAYLDAGQER